MHQRAYVIGKRDSYQFLICGLKIIKFDKMEALRIEILNPKALQLIKGMQDLNLIKVSDEPVSQLKAYLKKMRKNTASIPDLEEITKIVEEARAERYGKK